MMDDIVILEGQQDGPPSPLVLVAAGAAGAMALAAGAAVGTALWLMRLWRYANG